MRKLQFIIFCLILLFGQTLFGNIINIPDDYPTIQQGIDASVNGDTVIVDTGRYFENINYNGKNIVVASLFLTTQDTSYISQTVIDGDSLDSVVKFVSGEDSTSVLCGLTITNGSADCGGGIYCDFHSSPSLENVTITGNSANSLGGGICCDGSSPSLENVTISDNSANYHGGGICCYWSSSPSLENVTITGNSANSLGGGIYCYWFSSPSLENVTITGNSAASNGGGIYCTGYCSPILENVTITGNNSEYGGGICCWFNSSLLFSSTNRCNIYSNIIENMRGYGADIFTVDCDPIDIIVDTFTVLMPTDYYASPIDNYTFDILHSVKDNLINSDVYVSVDGDDSNTGTSADEPFRTIKHALSMIYSDSLNINTIHLAPGVYSDSTNGEIFPIVWSNYVNLQGSGEDETILDAHHTSRVLEFYGVSVVLIEEITIRNGNSYDGGGIYCRDFSSPGLENVTITGNSAASNGGGVYCKDNSSPSLVNVTINNNSVNYFGGGICCNYYSSPSLINSIVSDNTGNYGIYNYTNYPGNPTITYCDFWNNEGGNFYGVNDSIGVNVTTNANGDSCDVFYNIQLDPLFVDPLNGDYHLSWANFPIPDSTMSPCIDAGDPNSPLDPDGTVADMGALYFNQTVGVDDENHPSIETELFKNYPNPFNKITIIRYFLPKYTEVKIQIYNLKGQLVETIVDSNKPTGYYTIEWNAKDMSSGIYFYKLSTKDKTFINKMILLK
ncbi:MAG: right-handed parallel beta-helix repeat-containing protein [Candidatus Cloacimonetes bacterium]|nr:right-handed parallel beta-helix repeat-containing protein [Candidatus Cloacimonadota bacterium]